MAMGNPLGNPMGNPIGLRNHGGSSPKVKGWTSLLYSGSSGAQQIVVDASFVDPRKTLLLLREHSAGTASDGRFGITEFGDSSFKIARDRGNIWMLEVDLIELPSNSDIEILDIVAPLPSGSGAKTFTVTVSRPLNPKKAIVIGTWKGSAVSAGYYPGIFCTVISEYVIEVRFLTDSAQNTQNNIYLQIARLR